MHEEGEIGCLYLGMGEKAKKPPKIDQSKTQEDQSTLQSLVSEIQSKENKQTNTVQKISSHLQVKANL